jgi:hypothetical protein
MNNTAIEAKTYRVEVKTQFDTCSQRTCAWGEFGIYSGRTKADAIKRARRYNETYGCFDRRTNGLVWFRASEVEA